jgi:hypothetical protein
MAICRGKTQRRNHRILPVVLQVAALGENYVLEESGGEGGIRTHVPELPDHPISSRRRYDHFGTSPVNLKFFSFT